VNPSGLLQREERRVLRRMKPRHIFGALVLLAEAPLLAALIAGWLISGLIYAIGLGFERTRQPARAWRDRASRTTAQAAARPSSGPSRSVAGSA
jgi:hypothetical protein